MPDPFTLRIYVPSGDPEGVRIVDRMNWTGRGYVVPRDRWGELKVRPELARQGVYVLIGYETDELGTDRLVAYIGQTDNLRARIDGHPSARDSNEPSWVTMHGGLSGWPRNIGPT